MLCKKLLRPRPIFISAVVSTSQVVSHLRNGWNTSPTAHFFSTEAALQLPNEDRTKRNPKSSVVADKVELTKTLLRRYGFTDTHLSKLHASQPHLFNFVHPEKTLLPKLDFYRATIGFSNTDLPRIICSNTALLGSSLHNQIVPLYNFIQVLLLSGADSDADIVLKTLQRSPRILTYSLEKRIAPNISALTQAGVPQKQILYLLRCAPTVLGSSSLEESIKRAAGMGLHPNKLSFVDAIMMFTQMTKSTWDKKIEVYRNCGMTDAQILKAFRQHPSCMALSEGKIEQTMDFVVKKMGWQPVDVSLNPAVLDYSLEKRTIPRCKVVQYLQGKGLVKKGFRLASFLLMKEKDFIDKFVKKYGDDVPDLMDIYLAKNQSSSARTDTLIKCRV